MTRLQLMITEMHAGAVKQTALNREHLIVLVSFAKQRGQAGAASDCSLSRS
jgi:hypothetical protein